MPELKGTLEFQHLRSLYLSETRDSIIYLPPGYSDDVLRRYPVLYLHDGQNLFDPATAFLNSDWGLSFSVDKAIQWGEIEPLIIVGIYNAGVQRVAEYTHVRDRRRAGGRAFSYGKFLVRELKPLVDAKYRTMPDASHTGLGGSSLGGLVTLFLGLSNPSVFGRLIVMSPSVWWADRAITREVRKRLHHAGQKMWLDVGTAEGQSPETCLRDVRELRRWLVVRGWRLNEDLVYLEDEGGQHNEKAWGFRMPQALRFLFPARQTAMGTEEGQQAPEELRPR